MQSPEISGAFGKHLVDSYFECLHYACPAVRWETFYQEALVAGFNASQMGTPEGEVLCLVVQAFGARVVSVSCFPRNYTQLWMSSVKLS